MKRFFKILTAVFIYFYVLHDNTFFLCFKKCTRPFTCAGESTLKSQHHHCKRCCRDGTGEPERCSSAFEPSKSSDRQHSDVSFQSHSRKQLKSSVTEPSMHRSIRRNQNKKRQTSVTSSNFCIVTKQQRCLS